jgi:hypothetical protein
VKLLLKKEKRVYEKEVGGQSLERVLLPAWNERCYMIIRDVRKSKRSNYKKRCPYK